MTNNNLHNTTQKTKDRTTRTPLKTGGVNITKEKENQYGTPPHFNRHPPQQMLKQYQTNTNNSVTDSYIFDIFLLDKDVFCAIKR